jgi:hypothetical protein
VLQLVGVWACGCVGLEFIVRSSVEASSGQTLDAGWLTSVRHFSYLGYNILKDFFPTIDIKPNTGCCNNRCLEAQHLHQVGALQVGLCACAL